MPAQSLHTVPFECIHRILARKTATLVAGGIAPIVLWYNWSNGFAITKYAHVPVLLAEGLSVSAHGETVSPVCMSLCGTARFCEVGILCLQIGEQLIKNIAISSHSSVRWHTGMSYSNMLKMLLNTLLQEPPKEIA